MKGNNPQKLLKQSKIVIPHQDLSLALQQDTRSVRITRVWRGIYDGVTLANLAVALHSYLSKKYGIATGMGLATATAAVMRREPVKILHELHDEIRERKSPLIRSDVENRYPRDWIHVSEIIRTHPIFYVKGNGDLVLVKSSRAEYYRYRFQHEWVNGGLGKMGFNAWRWRGYLMPPTAPEKVRKWAVQKVKEAMQKWKEPPQPVHAHARYGRSRVRTLPHVSPRRRARS